MSSETNPVAFEAFWFECMKSNAEVLEELEVYMPNFKKNLRNLAEACFDMGYITSTEDFEKEFANLPD